MQCPLSPLNNEQVGKLCIDKADVSIVHPQDPPTMSSVYKNEAQCIQDCENANGIRTDAQNIETRKKKSKEQAKKLIKQAFCILMCSTNHPAAFQRTPMGMGRHSLLVMYTLYAFLTACVYFGWPSMSDLLVDSGAYAWLCQINANSSHETALPINENSSPEDENIIKGDLKLRSICDAQDAAIQQLFTITLATHSFFTGVSGFLLDIIGPKFTAITGQLFNLAGWLLLACASNTSRSYCAGMIFIGMGADTGFLPVLSLINLFPGNSGLVTTVLGAAASASFAIPPILQIILASFPQLRFSGICVLYLIFGPFLCFMIALTIFPRKTFLSPDRYTIDTDQTEIVCLPLKTDVHENVRDNDSINISATQSTSKTLINNSIMLEDKTSNIVKSLMESAFDENVDDKDLRLGDRKQPKLLETYNEMRCEHLDNKYKLKYFWSHFISPKYISVCIVYFVIVNIAICYYTTAMHRMFKGEIVDILRVLLPMSWLPCILLGKLADIWTIAPVMMIVNLSGFLSFILSILQNHVVHILSAISFCTYISLYTSQIFCFVQQNFTSHHFGKLSGISVMIGGLSSLAAYPIYDHLTIRKLGGDTTIVCSAFSIILAFMFLLLQFGFKSSSSCSCLNY